MNIEKQSNQEDKRDPFEEFFAEQKLLQRWTYGCNESERRDEQRSFDETHDLLMKKVQTILASWRQATGSKLITSAEEEQRLVKR